VSTARHAANVSRQLRVVRAKLDTLSLEAGRPDAADLVHARETMPALALAVLRLRVFGDPSEAPRVNAVEKRADALSEYWHDLAQAPHVRRQVAGHALVCTPSTIGVTPAGGGDHACPAAAEAGELGPCDTLVVAHVNAAAPWGHVLLAAYAVRTVNRDTPGTWAMVMPRRLAEHLAGSGRTRSGDIAGDIAYGPVPASTTLDTAWSLWSPGDPDSSHHSWDAAIAAAIALHAGS
jgi:uncharacterized MAPEG superfamily protein